MEPNKCASCKHFRISQPLGKRMCDFWERELKDEETVIGCNGYVDKEEVYQYEIEKET